MIKLSYVKFCDVIKQLKRICLENVTFKISWKCYSDKKYEGRVTDLKGSKLLFLLNYKWIKTMIIFL